MQIEKLANNALEYLRSKYTLPKRGIIAGGCLGNLIWEQVSGNIAVVNDIDIFIFENKMDLSEAGLNASTNDNKKMFYRSQEKIYWKDYTGLVEGSKTKQFYLINRTEHDGMLNYVYYSATLEDPNLVIDSFDINCTQIGYDIESGKFYWTPEFEEFLKDGNLKITNLGSPNHSAIRILKKRDELNANLEELEIKLCAYSTTRQLQGVTRKYFSTKYFEVYKKYSTELSEYFDISKEDDIKNLMRERDVDVDIYTLNCIKDVNSIFTSLEINDDAKLKIWHCNDFLFYIRNVHKEITNYKIWSKLQPLYGYIGYIDCDPQDEDIDQLSRIIHNIPDSIKILQGFKLSEQINLVKKLFKTFSEDLTIAFALLEKRKIQPDIIIDEQTKLLLELSVRVEIVNNKYDIDKILGKLTTPMDIINSDIDFLF
jgi:hypothetical protein